MVMFSSIKTARSVKWRFVWWGGWGAIIALGLMLGGWQWQRAEDKRIYLTALDSATTMNMPPQLPAEGAQVQLRGRYVPEATLFLDNRILNGRVGVAVLTPLIDENGRGWLIDRGFVPTGPRRHDPYIETPNGTIELEGQWQMAREGALLFGPNREGRRLQRIDLSAWQGTLRFAYAGWLHQTHGDGGFAPWWSPNVLPPARHIGYALQWWGLALAAAGVMWFGRRHAMSRSDVKEGANAPVKS